MVSICGVSTRRDLGFATVRVDHPASFGDLLGAGTDRRVRSTVIEYAVFSRSRVADETMWPESGGCPDQDLTCDAGSTDVDA